MDIFDQSTINHNNLGLLFFESLPTTSRSDGRLVGYSCLLFFCSIFLISESAFKQHVLRASIQTKTWMTSHQAKPPVASPYDYGWQKGSNGPTPILFSGLIYFFYFHGF
jgi:hypothetical protein